MRRKTRRGRARSACVAQLDRALASGARGRGFESRRAHSSKPKPPRERASSCGGFRASVRAVLPDSAEHRATTAPGHHGHGCETCGQEDDARWFRDRRGDEACLEGKGVDIVGGHLVDDDQDVAGRCEHAERYAGRAALAGIAKVVQGEIGWVEAAGVDREERIEGSRPRRRGRNKERRWVPEGVEEGEGDVWERSDPNRSRKGFGVAKVEATPLRVRRVPNVGSAPVKVYVVSWALAGSAETTRRASDATALVRRWGIVTELLLMEETGCRGAQTLSYLPVAKRRRGTRCLH